MSCTNRSEYRWAGLSRSASGADLADVRSVGVWHKAQPTAPKSSRPCSVDLVCGPGVGGARNRWKFAKFWIAVTASSGVVASKFCVSLGTVRELAFRGLVPLDLEELAGDAHLDVVGLA